MANVREIDRNDDKYVGIKFPLSYGLNGFFHQSKTVKEQSKSNLRNLLLTTPGERVMQPTFGCRLKDLLFGQMTNDIGDAIDSSIREATAKQLPYINLEEILSESVDNKVNIQITYSTTFDPNTLDSLILNFQIGDL